MRISEMGFLRDQWYALCRAEDLAPGTSRPVRLLGAEYVLWSTASGAPALSDPYCPHRGAHLGAAEIVGERLVCCYHGWEFDGSGACTRVPQLGEGLPVPPKARLRAYPVVERYAMLWGCVGEPPGDGPPAWKEADELGWRVHVDFFEPWAASALRILDNNIDQAHPAFVHRGTFGDPSRPLVPDYELVRSDSGFSARVVHEVAGVGPQMGIDDLERRFERVTEVELLDPVHTRILLEYDGLAPDYCFYGSATPLDDENSYYVRLSALASDDATQPYEMFHAYSRRIVDEDKVVLETTHGDFPLDLTSEVHLKCDKTTIEFRRILGRLAASTAPAPLAGAGREPGAAGSRQPVRVAVR